MQSKRILIIDDERDIREATQAILEIMGDMEVILAGSGAEGLVKAETEQPDAILLDVMLPGMDGPTTFQQLQSNPATQHIPVILLTAKVHSSDWSRFSKLGVRAVIAKPFNPEQLVDRIAQACGWSL
jgi:CheY-like chemotaxis protein